MRRFPLFLLVFWSGMVTLGVEFAAARLLAPYFGTSLIVWSALIGLILVYLSVGYWLGGRWADRSPRFELMIRIVTVAAVLIAAVPLVASPILRFALKGMAEFNGGLLAGTFGAVMVLFTVPMILLGCVSPFAIRLAVDDITQTGSVAGQLYALSTLGSFIGSFVPVLWLIPEYGTRWTFWLLALSLLLVATIGAAFSARRALLWTIIGIIFVLACIVRGISNTIKPPPEAATKADLLYEGESLYHYIRIIKDKDQWRLLELNEGLSTHSAYLPGHGTTGGVWDYFLLAPYFTAAPYDPVAHSKKWAIIGVAAGTTPRSIQTVYGDDPVVGVEIDGKIVEVANKFFAMDDLPNLEVVVEDGRTWLARDKGEYDVIGIDAYRQPYIPFHLTTVEFFNDVRAHLTERGVVAINVGLAPNDWRLVEALTSTMQEVFSNVYAIDVQDSYNTLLIGTNNPVPSADVIANLNHITHPAIATLFEKARDHTRIPEGNGIIFTDDRAPVEQVVDMMIMRFALNAESQE